MPCQWMIEVDLHAIRADVLDFARNFLSRGQRETDDMPDLQRPGFTGLFLLSIVCLK